MSEKIIRYLMSEVQNVRIVCRSCKAVVETTLESAAEALTQGHRCRFCNAEIPFSDTPRYNPLYELALVAEALKRAEKQLEVHLVFQDEDRS